MPGLWPSTASRELTSHRFWLTFIMSQWTTVREGHLKIDLPGHMCSTEAFLSCFIRILGPCGPPHLCELWKESNTSLSSFYILHWFVWQVLYVWSYFDNKKEGEWKRSPSGNHSIQNLEIPGSPGTSKIYLMVSQFSP